MSLHFGLARVPTLWVPTAPADGVLFPQETVKALWLVFDSLFIIYDPVIITVTGSLYKAVKSFVTSVHFLNMSNSRITV